MARKKQFKEIKQLRKDIQGNRTDLDNAIQGDRQQLRNTLAEHRDLQLGFQNLPPIVRLIISTYIYLTYMILESY